LQSLHYTRADEANKGDEMSSAPVERERYSKAPTYPDLAGKVAVVTGGSGGIGAATCRLLAANGAKVAVNGRDGAKIEAVVDAIRSTGGEALGSPQTAPTSPRSSGCASKRRKSLAQ